MRGATVATSGDALSPEMQRQHRFASVTEDDIHRYLPISLLASVAEVETETDERSAAVNGSGDPLDDTEDPDVAGVCPTSSLCWSCARVIRNKSRRAMPNKLIQFGRGKSRMTSSELSDDDERSLLPKPHSIVANYARMLCENRPLFVETLFRAVKLNKLDVTKVLCKIVQVCKIITVIQKTWHENFEPLFQLKNFENIFIRLEVNLRWLKRAAIFSTYVSIPSIADIVSFILFGA
jgi:hypothetical protein